MHSLIQAQYGSRPLENPDYGRIINRKHFDRIRGLIDPQKVAAGGGSNESTLQIEPPILDNVTWNDAVMQEEIFGPVLPILTYEDPEEIYAALGSKPKPLLCTSSPRTNGTSGR